MPSIDRLQWERNSGKSLQAEGCGSISFLPSTDNAARGLPSVTMLVFDEAGFPSNFPELYGAGTASQEMVPASERKTIICTTIPPDGVANPVWEMFANTNQLDRDPFKALSIARCGGTNCGVPGVVFWTDINGWAKIAISHTAHPIYGSDPNFVQSVCLRRKIPTAIAQREHNLGIEQANDLLFSAEAIAIGGTGAWQNPVVGRKYFAMIDPNFGGSDNFVLLMFDITRPVAELVAEYCEADRTTMYSCEQVFDLVDRYNPIALAIESNAGGKVVWEVIQKERPALNTLLTLTTHTSKIVNTDRVALELERGTFNYPPDWPGCLEMSSFSAQKRQAVAGKKDDRVMALAAGFAHMKNVRRLILPNVQRGKARF